MLKYRVKHCSHCTCRWCPSAISSPCREWHLLQAYILAAVGQFRFGKFVPVYLPAGSSCNVLTGLIASATGGVDLPYFSRSFCVRSM